MARSSSTTGRNRMATPVMARRYQPASGARRPSTNDSVGTHPPVVVLRTTAVPAGTIKGVRRGHDPTGTAAGGGTDHHGDGRADCLAGRRRQRWNLLER